MLKKFCLVMIFPVFFGMLSPVGLPVAHAYVPMYAQIMDRIVEQQQRIQQGVRTGALTRQEAAILQDNLNWIRRTVQRYKNNDGWMNGPERARIDRMLDRNSDLIHQGRQNRIKRLY